MSTFVCEHTADSSPSLSGILIRFHAIPTTAAPSCDGGGLRLLVLLSSSPKDTIRVVCKIRNLFDKVSQRVQPLDEPISTHAARRQAGQGIRMIRCLSQ